jgi:hypothetical protein
MRVSVLMGVATLAMTTLPALPAEAAPGGSYMQSCRDIRDAGRGQMSAQCRDTRGRYRFTTLNYSGCVGDIGNNDGQLICNGGRPGNGGGGNGPGGNGPGWGGGNGPGNGGGWNGPMPGGSWQRSCRNAQMRGSRITAQCQGENGRRWFDTSIDMRACRSGRLANQNGQLVCS